MAEVTEAGAVEVIARHMAECDTAYAEGNVATERAEQIVEELRKAGLIPVSQELVLRFSAARFCVAEQQSTPLSRSSLRSELHRLHGLITGETTTATSQQSADTATPQAAKEQGA